MNNQHVHASPRVRSILSNEHWFGDGPPHWQSGKRPFTASEVADADRLTRASRLRAAGDTAAEKLAKLISECSAKHRCMSGACPCCNRAFCRWFVNSGSEFLSGNEAAVLSIVPADAQIPFGQLSPEDLRKFVRQTSTRMRRAGVSCFLGATDISANEDEDDEAVGFYQLQFWGLTPSADLEALKARLRSQFTSSDSVPRPSKVQPWDGSLSALGYAWKSDFARRVSYIDTPQKGNRGPCRNTRDRYLRVHQLREVMIALDQVGLHSRMHLGSLRVVNTRTGPMIRPIAASSVSVDIGGSANSGF